MIRLAIFLAAIATSAQAYTITPPGPTVAHGQLLATTPGQSSAQSYPATWTINVTSAGVGKVTGLTLPGPVTFSGFPWSTKACGLNCLTIKSVVWTSASGTCGPVTIHATLANATIGVNYAAGSCEFLTGALTTPALSIAP